MTEFQSMSTASLSALTTSLAKAVYLVLANCLFTVSK